jgi:hypothetical protein
VRAVAINVGANTNEPGVRGPVAPDGRFVFVPIPETAPTAEPVPTYADLDLPVELPPRTADRPVHLDPAFAEYPAATGYTYGDPHGVKARPILDLEAGDYLFFYATLSVCDVAAVPRAERAPDAGPALPPDWGAFLVGHFRLARAPLSGDAYRNASATTREQFQTNAHCKRATFDARVLARGAPAASRLYDRAIPLSTPAGGTEAGPLVTEHSADSGAGPWWRRPLRYDVAGTRALLDAVADAGSYQ